MLISRLIKSNNKKEVTKEIIIEESKKLKVSDPVNSLFTKILQIDEFFINKGVSLPFGGSLIVVAKKI